jgi:dihydroneopterin aldolase
MNREPSDWIHLTKMTLPCVLGVFPWEHLRRQQLAVEISLRLDLEVAARGELSTTLDYGSAFEQVRFITRHGRWPLVESLAFALARHLLAPPAPGETRPPVEEARVKLCKPEALQGRATPSVEVQRLRAWCELHRSATRAAVEIESLQETADTGAYHVDLAAGATWQPPKSARVHVISGRPSWGDRLLPPGNAWGPSDDLIRNAASPARLLVVAEPPLRAG